MIGRKLAASLLVAIAASAFAPRAPAIPVGPESANALVTVVGSLPSPRSRTSAVWPGNGAAYVFGGRTGLPDPVSRTTPTTRQIVAFVPGLGSAVAGQLPPAPGSSAPNDGREDTAAIWDGQNAYVFGGYDSSFNPIDEIVRFNPSTGNSSVVAHLPFPTAGATAVWDGGSAYIFGGYVKVPGQTQLLLSAQIVRFTPFEGGGTVTLLPQTLPSPRNHAAAVYETPAVYGDPAVYEAPYVHIYGGHLGLVATDQIVRFAPGSVFAPGSGEISVEGRLPSPRHDTSAIWLPGSPAGPGSAYVFGGHVSNRDDVTTDEVVAHDPVNGESVRVVDRLVAGRSYTSAVASDPIGGYLFGGEDLQPGSFSDQIVRFTRPIRYAALGDSYSSGEGLGEDGGLPPYLPSGDPGCHRHRLAYPELFEWNGPTELDFLACSGARTEHIYRQPQRPRPGPCTPSPPSCPAGEGQGYPGQAGRPELNKSTDLVTMTIGGNDVGEPDSLGNGGLSKPLSFCYSHPTCNKNGKFIAGIKRNLGKLPTKLRRTFIAVKAKTGPDTTIAVLGYPRAFPTDANPKRLKQEQDCAKQSTFGVGWAPREQTFLNGATDQLNGLIARAAAAEGVYFFNPTRYFTGHAICDEGERWINGLTGELLGTPRFGYGPGSFHPNVAGQNAYKDFLTGSLLSRVRNPNIFARRLTPVGLPANPTPTRPQVELSEVETVRLGQASRFRGTAGDPGGFGIASAGLNFGDGTSQKVRVGQDGSFTVLHRYARAGRFTARLLVFGGEGNVTTAEVGVSVTRRR